MSSAPDSRAKTPEPAAPDAMEVSMAPLTLAASAVQGYASENASPESNLLAAQPSKREKSPMPKDRGLLLPPVEDRGKLEISQDGLDTNAKVDNDGRVNININQRSRRLSTLLAPALRSQLDIHQQPPEPEPSHPAGYIPTALGGEPGQEPPPPMNVVIHVVGSRGDVQPFVALGKTLKDKYRHRVRLATHPTFKQFVEENGLEFFSIGGDPAELMAFMVKNPGLLPGIETLKSGDVGKRRKGIYEIVKGCWRSCIDAGDGMGIDPNDDSMESRTSFDSGVFMDSSSLANKPFIADAIIANPPSFAHIHIAEKMGIPVHLMFTMPWSPTQSFPHPLANIQSSNVDNNLANFVSYALVEMMTWQGLGDVINRFRELSLGLEPISVMWAPGMATRLRIPYTYCWSPALIPKPKDWGPHISISGFFFLSLASSFSPEPGLAAFLKNGPPPVYIGFGSIVLDDPDAMTALIFEAVKKAGVRALVSKGWGGFGGDDLEVPENIFMLGNVPHDWLFPQVSCVVHHGGAGTTAAGIQLGKPTVVVPFFGDQPFWGSMIARAGAGPLPIPHKHLTADNLAAAILEALTMTAKDKAKELGQKISQEEGTESAARSFHEQLKLDRLRCSFSPGRVAVWRVKHTNFRLSGLAATVLGNEGHLDFKDLKLYRSQEYDVEDGPWDPISGGASALLGTLGSLMMGVADFPVEIVKAVKGTNQDTKEKRDSIQTIPTRSSMSTVLSLTRSGSRSRSRPGSPSGSQPGSRPGTPTSSTPIIRSNSVSIGELQNNARKSAEAAEEGRRDSSSSQIDPIEDINPGKSLEDVALHGVGSNSTDATSQGSEKEAPLSKMQMVQRIADHVMHARSNTQSATDLTAHHTHHHHNCPICKASRSAVVSAGKGVGRIVEAGLKAPMDFTLGLARGFHNAPKLYGDSTVRAPDKVTGIQSGLKAAGKARLTLSLHDQEFGYGFYDGISGLVTQPVLGAKDEGPVGLVKGFAKGLGGVVLKPGAAIFGMPGYTFKGIYKELQKHFGSSVQNYIIAARTAQGYEDWRDSSAEERLQIIHRWHLAQPDIKKAQQTFTEEAHQRALKLREKRHWSFDERRKLAKEHKKDKVTHKLAKPSAPGPPPVRLGDSYEHAIQASVSETSRGDKVEDQLIERAIRASVTELVLAEGEHADDEAALDRAIKATIAEAGKGPINEPAKSMPHTAADNLVLEQTLRQSLAESTQSSVSPLLGLNDGTDSALGMDSDLGDKSTLHSLSNAASLPETPVSTVAAVTRSPDIIEADLEKALEASKLAHSQREKDDARAKIEEEIVMEYVKRQSLAEQELKLAHEESRSKQRLIPDTEMASPTDKISDTATSDQTAGQIPHIAVRSATGDKPSTAQDLETMSTEAQSSGQQPVKDLQAEP